MIIFLYGQDSYRSRQKLNEIINHYKETHKSGLNLKYFDGRDLDFQDFKTEFQTIPMFQEKKLLVLTDVFSNNEFKEEFLKNSEKFLNSDNIILIHEEKEAPSDDSFFTFLKKQAKSQEFTILEGQRLKNWVKKELNKYQVKTDLEVIEKLISYVDNDLWQLANEIKKLASYKNKDKIELKDIDLLIRPKTETYIFKTIDAISSKNKKQALDLLHQHLEKGDNPLYLLTMINYQFRNILEIKDLIEKKKPLARSQLHPFVIKKSYQQAQKFSLDELKKIYHKIFEADYNIKTGKIDAQTALDLLIAEI